MYVLLTILLVNVPVNIVNCACGKPYIFPGISTFGPECRYKCNCINNEQCDPIDGECPNGCLQGWMGPACQYRNLASAANPVNSEQYPPGTEFPPSYAIDGNISTCSRTGRIGSGQRYLRIDLVSPVFIVGLVVRIPPSAVNTFRSFTVDVGNSSSGFRMCYSNKRTSDVNEVMEINCFEPQVGSQIQIQLAVGQTEYLSVCEIGIYGGRIISFNKKTDMNTIFTGPDGTYYGAHAVDGKVHNNDPAVTVAATCAASVGSPGLRWWSVNLLHSFSIQAVNFFARQDGENFLDQCSGYYITFGADNSTSTEIFRDQATKRQTDYKPKSHNLTWPRDGRYINVKRDNETVLSICELEIFAECAYGSCGWNCNETCMCSSQTAGAHKILGICPHGCSGRWTGMNGKCNMECPDNKWGPTCSQNCGYCTLPCNVVNGTCPEHCYPGWEPPYCTQACREMFFGLECKNECGKCRNGIPCNSVNGHCPAGCAPGWETAPFCNKFCDIGTFGDQCSERCGHCLDEEICHHENGMCFNGCEAGYMGKDCRTACPDGRFGANCLGQCGACSIATNCNKETGDCSNGCLPGWQGRNCTMLCTEGRYGEGCQNTCGSCVDNEACNRTTGACAHGCSDQFTGSLCKEVKGTTNSEQTGWIVGIGVCIAAIIVAVFIIVILIYKLRKQNKQTSSAYTESSVVATVSEDETYDCIIRSPSFKMEQYEYINSPPSK